MTIDWTKPIQTKDGRKARVLCTDLKGHSPIVIAVSCLDSPDEGVIVYCTEGGVYSRSTPIINVPIKHTGWLNVYKYDVSDIHFSKADAEYSKTAGRVACIPITYTEGEGLDE